MKSDRIFWALAAFFLMVLIWTYSNHYDNGFHFDDFHTITSNKDIRDFSNPSKFFTDGTTGTSKGGINYRPMVALMNAFDYWRAGDYIPSYFHRHIFFWYVVQVMMMFLVFKNIMDKYYKDEWNRYIALFSAAYFGVLTINAETVNYVISRSDGFSTMAMVAGIWFYQMKFTRKFHLYLLPMIIALLTKQSAIMFPPILFMYILLFEEEFTFENFLGPENRKRILNTMIKAAPAFIVGVGLFIFNQKVMTPISGYNKGRSKWLYFISQWYAIAVYTGNTIIPAKLVVEMDLKLAKSIFDSKVILGAIVNLAIIAWGLWGMREKKYYPIAFGIIWFYLAYVPASSIVPRFQVSNFHRSFFPTVGWALAVGWTLGIFAINNKEKIKNNQALRYGIPAVATFIIMCYAFATHQRNTKWINDEVLWYDAVEKGSKSGRVLKFWGDVLKKRGKKKEALETYNKALIYWPINPGLNLAMADIKKEIDPNINPDEIEVHLKAAYKRGGVSPTSYRKYGKFLYQEKRYKEAKKVLEKAERIKEKTDMHINEKEKCRKLLAKVLGHMEEGVQSEVDSLLSMIAEEPSNTNKLYDKLANVYYKSAQYDKSVEAAQQSISRKETAKAYNLLCIAYNKKKEWDKGKAACEKALEIKPEHKKAKANRDWSIKGKEKEEKAKAKAAEKK